ncbi:MAG: pitrilysin family protein [Polyangiaceae bacterium]
MRTWSAPFTFAAFALVSLAACSDPQMTPPPPFPTTPTPTATPSASASAEAAVDSIENKPALPDAKAFDPPAPEVVKLSNGMTLWLIERHTLPLVAVSVAMPIGSSDDPVGKEGLASITADMMDEGAGGRSAIEVSTALQDLGVNLRTSVSLDGSVFSLTVLKKSFPQAFGILADVIARPRFEEKEWKRVSDLWKNSLLKRADDPDEVGRVIGQIAAYGPKHPYGHPADGFVESAKKIDLGAVKAFYGAQYRPEKIVLSIAGDVTKAEVAAAVDDAFGSWKPGPPPAAEPREAQGSWTPPRVVLVDRPKAPQSLIAVVRDGVRLSDPKASLYDLVNTAIGGSFTSRLNQNLREDHNWTYGAGSAFTETRRGGVFIARAAVETKHTGPALEEMLKELRTMAASGLTSDELTKVRAQDRSDLVRLYESVSGMAGRFATLSFLGLPPDYDVASSRTRQGASLEALNELARAVDPAKGTIVVVGPRSEVGPALAKYGTPEIWDPEGNPVKADAAPDAAPKRKAK